MRSVPRPRRLMRVADSGEKLRSVMKPISFTVMLQSEEAKAPPRERLWWLTLSTTSRVPPSSSLPTLPLVADCARVSLHLVGVPEPLVCGALRAGALSVWCCGHCCRLPPARAARHKGPRSMIGSLPRSAGSIVSLGGDPGGTPGCVPAAGAQRLAGESAPAIILLSHGGPCRATGTSIAREVEARSSCRESVTAMAYTGHTERCPSRGRTSRPAPAAPWVEPGRAPRGSLVSRSAGQRARE